MNTACDTMQAAVTFGQDELQEATMAYIETNTQVGGMPGGGGVTSWVGSIVWIIGSE